MDDVDGRDGEVAVEAETRATWVEELDWYYGEGDAAIGHRGMDPGAGGGGRVHDEAAHDALLLSKLDPRFRLGIWKRDWVDLALKVMDPRPVKTLALAFSPRRWQLVEDSRSASARSSNELSHVEARLRKKLASGTAIVTTSTIDDRGRPHIERIGVSLLALAISSGSAQQALEGHPMTGVMRESHPDWGTTLRDVLGFLEMLVENSAIADNRKVSGAAEGTLRKIKDGAEAHFDVAMLAYGTAASYRDPEQHPDRIGKREWRRRYEERQREMFDRPDPKVQERARRLQAGP